MTTNPAEKSFAVDAKYANFYLGGDVAWSIDGQVMYCLNGNEVSAVALETGLVTQNYGVESNTDEEEQDVIYTFALAPNNEYLITAHRSGLLRLWSLQTHKVEKMWKAQHKGPIIQVEFSPCSVYVCTSGAADATLRIWDYANNRCLCALKDFPAPATLLCFHPNAEKKEIFAVAADNSIYCWNFELKELTRKFSGHLSQVTAISFAYADMEQAQYLASVSRDKVLIVWDLQQNTQYKVIPMYEELEGVCFLDEHKLKVIVASSNGNLKLVHCHKAKIVGLVEQSDYETKKMLHCRKQKQLALVTADHNILVYDIESSSSLKSAKQLVGYNDEVLDVCLLGENDRFLAVATNSKSIKIYDTENNMNCKVVYGHNDTVMCLSSSGGGGSSCEYLLSAGKDYSVYLWRLDASAFELRCIGKNPHSHTATIGSIAFAYHTHTNFATASQDGSIKVWQLKTNKDAEKEVYTFSVRYAAVAHQKEVNCIAYAPNNKMLATASQDKTVKVWNADSQNTLGVLRGHTRGVWCVRFSPVDQVLLSTSSDCSMRIWSLANMSCLKRLEQECTVLRAEFIDHGKYIVSAASDGLLKVWNIKTNACVQTLDEHNDRIWSLAISERSNKTFFSGGADSKLIKWRDVTTECRNKEIDERQAHLQQEQLLQTLLHQRQSMQKAFLLALNLGKPKTTYKIIAEYFRQRDEETVKSVISQLNVDQRGTLLEHVKAWSTNSRYSKVANIVLNFILNDMIVQPEQRLYNTANMVEVLTPYVQRHFKRVNELNKELTFLEFLVKSMDA